MPHYEYRHPDTGEVKEILQKMTEEHVYEENGVKWNRIFTVPQVSIDTININPFSSKDFLKKTDKAGSVGDLLDRSKEMSEKRKEKDGIDKIQQKYFKEYSKARKGRKNPAEIRQNLQAKEIIV